MASMYRVRSLWTGFSGAPGYTNMYFGTTDPLLAGASLAVSDVRAFWQSIVSLFPDDVQINVEANVQVVDDATGLIENELSATPVSSVNGSATTGYAAPVGASIEWRTAAYVNGRRVKGRTYVVPILGGSFETDGTLGPTQLGLLQTSAAAFIAAASNFVVWHRPREASAGPPPVSASAGSLHLVTAASVSDRAAVLRSRRD
jgi:hypothetical protein